MNTPGRTLNRAAIPRIFKLDRMIRLGRFESAQKAADEFEVSRRTIERDLEDLRYKLGAELEYNREKGSYRYKGNAITLPAQWLNEREIAILLIAERALRIFTATAFDNEIHPAFNKLLDPIRHDTRTIRYISDLCNSVYFHRPVEPIRDIRDEFSVVLDAIMKRRRLAFFYPAAGKTSGESREMDPYALANSGGEWYIVGMCCRSRTIKTFVLSKISVPEIDTELAFDIPSTFKVEKHLEQGFGRMHSDDRIQQVELAIRSPAAGWISRSKWHPSQKVKKKADGSIGLSMTCPVTDTLVRWVMQMAECVTVIKPAELRELVTAKARKLIANQVSGRKA